MVNVRELAAVDMYGSRGSERRRRIILGEFLLGAVAGPTLGVIVVAIGGFGVVLGIWAIGVGLNYVPLAIHAIALLPGDRLRRELEGVDIPAALRHYTLRQFWVGVPFLFVGLDAVQRRVAA